MAFPSRPAAHGLGCGAGVQCRAHAGALQKNNARCKGEWNFIRRLLLDDWKQVADGLDGRPGRALEFAVFLQGATALVF